MGHHADYDEQIAHLEQTVTTLTTQMTAKDSLLMELLEKYRTCTEDLTEYKVKMDYIMQKMTEYEKK